MRDEVCGETTEHELVLMDETPDGYSSWQCVKCDAYIEEGPGEPS